MNKPDWVTPEIDDRFKRYIAITRSCLIDRIPLAKFHVLERVEVDGEDGLFLVVAQAVILTWSESGEAIASWSYGVQSAETGRVTEYDEIFLKSAMPYEPIPNL